MKKLTISLLLALSTACTLTFAQSKEMRAVTEDGRKVLLAPNGKWRFDPNVRSLIAPSPVSDSGSPYQTGVKKFSVAFNASEWTLMPKRESDPVTKRMFQHKAFPIYAMVMADEIPADKSSLRNIILYNANSAGATTTVLLEKTRKLGDHEIGELRMTAATTGLEFVFSTYYYADDDGNIQLMCYTAQSLFHKYQDECEKFLSGLIIKP